MGDDLSGIFKIGPAGNANEQVWDEKGKDQIVQIFISHDDKSGIASIQFQYLDENGSRVMSERHGCCHGYDSPKFSVVNLKYSFECVTWISGNVCDGDLGSLAIGTKFSQHGPFGRSKHYCCRTCSEFRFELGEDRQFHGFHGHANNHGVKSIGVYLKPTTVMPNLKKNKISI